MCGAWCETTTRHGQQRRAGTAQLTGCDGVCDSIAFLQVTDGLTRHAPSYVAQLFAPTSVAATNSSIHPLSRRRHAAGKGVGDRDFVLRHFKRQGVGAGGCALLEVACGQNLH